MKYAFVPATFDHCVYMAPRLRRADYREVSEMGGLTALDSLRISMELSAVAWTWLVDGVPAVMFGVEVPYVIGDMGRPWCLTTKLVEQNKREMWRASKGVVALWRERYARMEGYCDGRYEQSLNWIKRLGFTVEPPVTLAEFGVPVCRFSIG